MRDTVVKVNRFLDAPIDLGPRLLLALALVCLVPTFFAPLYDMTMFAPQYPDGLRLHIYSYTLTGGNGGQDVREINVLNHYIGMKHLAVDSFAEFNWLPFVIGVFGLLFLRAAVLGKMSHLVDVLVLYLFFGLFSMWSFGYRMYQYGHQLDPGAPVHVPPFMPPMFGYKKLANFEVYSYPAFGAYALAAVALCLLLAFLLAWRQWRREQPVAAPLARLAPSVQHA